MKNDLRKIFSRTIITYIYILSFIVIVKLIGLDYFGLDLSNPVMLKINNVLENNWILRDIIYFSQLILTGFIMLRLYCNSKDKKVTIIFILNLIPLYFFEVYKLKIFGNFAPISEILYFIILSKIYNKNVKTKRIILYDLLFMFLQLLSYSTRYKYSLTYVNNIIPNILLNLDYIILLIIIYNLNFMKGDEKLCYQEVLTSSSGQLTSLKKQLRRFQTNYSNLNKKEKFEFITIWTLYLLWNIFTVFVVLFVAMLNDSVIECIIILSSFWINKTVFGKAFHLKNARDCFILSNLVYYFLNRITTPIGISILIPICLGILLSYFTSKLVKENKIILKRGMTKEQVYKLLDKINAEPIDYKICELFYVNRYTDLKISNMLNYSEINIKKRKQKVNKQIKELFI